MARATWEWTPSRVRAEELAFLNAAPGPDAASKCIACARGRLLDAGVVLDFRGEYPHTCEEE